jgi:MoaA/NifB/PqqE/SkfB family radical SAM enzyme
MPIQMHPYESIESRNEAAFNINDLRFLWLEITGKCNLTCTHCYADSSPASSLQGSMNYDDWLRVIDEAAELGCNAIQFIGGEPTLHPHLLDFIAYTKGRGIGFVEVYTNATRITPELVECLKRNQVHVATSFYSKDADTHEHITQGRGSWERTVNGIKAVLAAALPLRVGVIEMADNSGHAPEATNFLKELGVRGESINVDYQRGVGRAAGLVRIDGGCEDYSQLCGQCWKARLCVTSTGEVYPCVFSRSTQLGDVHDGLKPILTSARLRTFREDLRELQSRRHTPSTACHPSLGTDSHCHPTVETDSHCHPTVAMDSRCHPSLVTDSHCHPEVAMDSRRHPTLGTDSHCHPEVAMDRRCHPTLGTDSHCHPEVAMDSRCHPTLGTDSHCHPEVAMDSRCHPTLGTGSHYHPV